MKERVIQRAVVLTLVFVACGVAYITLLTDVQSHSKFLEVSFLDIGQGDATFIELPNGVQVLIDGGPDASILRELSSIMGFFDRSIDMVVATHPDKDHIGGLTAVLKRYEVGTILLTENESETPISETFKTLVQNEGAKLVYARTGMEFGMDGAVLTVLFPDRDPADLESNTSSIVLKLNYGSTNFLMTGDSPQAIEKYLVSLYGGSLHSDVLKVGHHGSRTSTAEEFVAAVGPQYAIISSGKNNRYGHPHKEVLSLLGELGIKTENTADVGTITIASDGINVVLSTEND